MSAPPGSQPAAPKGPRPPEPRTLMVSFLGAIVRRMGNWMPIAGTVDLMTQAGLDAAGVRTAVFRLKERGWLTSEMRESARGYALTPMALRTLAEGDEIIWHARQPAELADGWCIVSASVPETARGKRHQLRSHLAHLGFGNISTAMWIAPARMQVAAQRALDDLGLNDHAALFVGDYAGTRDLTGLLYDSWNLGEIDLRYREFIDQVGDRATQLESTTVAPAQAFVDYLRVVDHWRKLPFRDPGLPREVLAADWSAPRAVALFERLVSALEGRALAHAAAHWPAPGG